MGQIIKFPIVVLTDKADETRSGITPKLESTIRQTPNALTTALGSEKAVRNAINEIDITLSGYNLSNNLNVFNDTQSVSGYLKTVSYNTLSGQGIISVYQNDENIMLQTTQSGIPGSVTGTIINTRTINGGIYQEASVLNYSTFMATSSIECFHNLASGDIIGKVMIKCTEAFNNGAIQYSIGTDEDKEGIVKKFYAPVTTGLVKITYGDLMLDKVEVVEKNKTYVTPKLKDIGNIKVYKYGIANLTQGEMNCVIFYDKNQNNENALHNYWGDGSDGDVTISTNTTWDSGGSGEMIVKNYNNLTINNGVTLTIYARKGALIYVKGNFTNNGTVVCQSRYSADPVAEGVSATGIRFAKYKIGATDILSASELSGCGATAIAAESNQDGINGNGQIYTISRIGSAGGHNGILSNAATGTNGDQTSTTYILKLGGGGSGNTGVDTTYHGCGGNATCWSSGTGGAGVGGGYVRYTAYDGSDIGGAGGHYGDYNEGNGVLGGAGNPAYPCGAIAYAEGRLRDAEYKTGGLLCIFAKNNLINNGIIDLSGGYGTISLYQPTCCGGGSGAGGGLFLYGNTYIAGTININGGNGGRGSGYTINPSNNYAGNGGNGYIISDKIIQ